MSEYTAAKMEAVADFVGDCLFGGNNAATEKLLSSLNVRERNRFVQWVKNIFAKIKQVFKGTDKLSEIERLENEFLEVANTVYKMNKAEAEQQKTTTDEGSGVKYAIVTLDNGMSYVQASRKVITGKTVKEQRAQITEFFNRALKAGPIEIDTVEGDVLTITKDTKKKARSKTIIENGVERELTDNEFRVKLNAEAHIDELAELSKKSNKAPVPDTKNHPFAKDGFTYRTVYFQDFDGSYYRVTLSIGENNGVSTVYNVGKIKTEDIPDGKIISTIGSKADMSSLRHSIPNSTETVNRNSSEQENIKQKQLEIIKETNPMWDEYHTGIRTIDDIRTWDEVLELDDEREGQFVWGDFSRADAERALKDGTITVYSSYPIENGVFVSTSYIQAEEYAGGRGSKVYSKTIPLTDVAWINGDEGQYAVVDNLRYSLPENPTVEQIGQALVDGEISMEQYRSLLDKAYNQTVKEQGAIEQGEMVAPPNKPNPTPVSVKPGTKVSEHVRTILESGYASPDMEAYHPVKHKILKTSYSFCTVRGLFLLISN